ncbi:MAG: hypothetical protein QOK35_1429 [Pseudonocardiales bacterium]|nr:hypothetical protein [Pseudonocardiales bacterium]
MGAAVRQRHDVPGVGAVPVGVLVAAAVAVLALLAALVAQHWLLAFVVLLLLFAAAAVGVVVGVVQPVRALVRDVHRTAHAFEVEAAALDERPRGDTGPHPPPITARGTRDVVALAAAVTSLQDAASSLAAAHHRSRLRTSDLMIHVGRRNQALLDRLTGRIADLAILERDTRAHAELDRLNHVAGRARRHAESVLVLTESAPDRVGPRPTGLVDVLRAALAGVEDHARVDTAAVEPAAVTGPVVADLAHLVAELVENAAHFSPPEARVTITGTPLLHGYRLRIADRGVGMTETQLDEANDRLRLGTSGPVATRLIGLDVVGRLAARHGISVVLNRGDGEGVVVTVTVPATALVPVSDLPAPRRPVSALVAAAAFRPPSAGVRPASGAGGAPSAPPTRAAQKKKKKAAPPEPAVAFVRPGVPRRVPGAQLPDLGPERDDDPRVVPDAGRVRVRLDALQGGLSAARTHNIPPLPRPLPGTDGPPGTQGASPPAPRTPADGDG